MKQSIIYFIIMFHICSPVWAQKKKLDLSAAAIWPYISAEEISDNGEYVSYLIGSEAIGDTLFIRSLKFAWEKKYLHGSHLQFSPDSRLAVFKSKDDTVCLLTLGTDHIDYIPHVASYKLAPEQQQKWLACQLKDSTKTLLLRNLLTGKELKYANVTDYLFSDNGRMLLLQTSGKAKKNIYDFTLCDLLTGKEQIINRGEKATDFCFDRTGSQLAFLRISNGENSLWYYKSGMESAKKLVDSTTVGMAGYSIFPRSFIINTIYTARLSLATPFFSGDGHRIFLIIKPKAVYRHDSSGDTLSKVRIWNFQDEVVSPSALVSHDKAVLRKGDRSLLATVNLSDQGRIIPLQESSNDYSANLDNSDAVNYVISRFSHSVPKGSRWRSRYSLDISLISTDEGQEKVIAKNLAGTIEVYVSISGKYVLWYDGIKRNYFTYNTSSGAVKNITAGIPERIYRRQDVPDVSGSFGLAGWLRGDTALLVYDQYDIWQVDPAGKKRPIDLTGGAGRKSGVMFRVMDFGKYATIPAALNDTLYLTALNKLNRWNGFYKMIVDKPGILARLAMGPRMEFFPQQYSFDINGVADRFCPIKAKEADVWLVKVMSPSEYPNLYVTHDFRSNQRLTNLEPQRNYNWYTSSLLHWKLPNGNDGQGILYKPEDFSPKKKYPIIFFYYEKNSDAVNAYLYPELSPGTLNIPWFVSHGYLVFVPDIQFKIGYPGQSVLDCVVSAAKHLMKEPWVDGNRMGIQGHSFGGYETNFIITRTHLFAAAISAAGNVDLPMAYGDAISVDWMNYYEFGQGRMGAGLGQKPALYMLNSPILSAGKVNTPLLIMSNKADFAVQWYQGLSWFAILQHLGKKVWLLQYDEGHVILGEHNQMDYSIRMGQFFDHYLKGTPAPAWMTGQAVRDGKR